MADAVAKLNALAASGVHTIVDPTVIGLGRYIPRSSGWPNRCPTSTSWWPRVATRTTTSVLLPPPDPGHRRPPRPGRAGADGADVRRRHHRGDRRTGVRAGMLKCAVDEAGLTEGVERVMRAVAQAHLATGCPITVHTHPGSQRGLDVQRVMAEEGVDPGRVVLGHSGDSTDVDHLSALAGAGFWLGMDRFGINLQTPFEARADTVVELCRRGLADRMVLAHDAACYIDWIDPDVLPMLPQWHYLHIEQEVLPYLRDHGVTEEQSARCHHGRSGTDGCRARGGLRGI